MISLRMIIEFGRFHTFSTRLAEPDANRSRVSAGAEPPVPFLSMSLSKV